MKKIICFVIMVISLVSCCPNVAKFTDDYVYKIEGVSTVPKERHMSLYYVIGWNKTTGLIRHEFEFYAPNGKYHVGDTIVGFNTKSNF